MPLPDSVARQEAEAEAALAAIEAGQAASEAEPNTLVLPEEAAPVVAPTDTPDDGNPFGLDNQEPVVADPPAPVAEVVDPETIRHIQAQLSTLKGKYDSEVPRLSREKQELEARLAEAMARPPADPVEFVPKPTDDACFAHVTDEEKETMGAEMLEFHGRVAQGISESMLTPIVALLSQLVEDAGNDRDTRAAKSTWDRIEELVPGATAINDSDTGFPIFLAELDPASGQSYKDLAVRAMSGGDISRLADIFKMYMKISGKLIPADTGDEQPPAPARVPPVKPSAAPRAPVPLTADSKPLLKTSDIDSFYQDCARGKYAKKPAEKAKLEKMIDDATDEGRIVQG